jgi:hypothetical protein
VLRGYESECGRVLGISGMSTASSVGSAVQRSGESAMGPMSTYFDRGTRARREMREGQGVQFPPG